MTVERTYTLQDLEPVLHQKAKQIAALIRNGDLEAINVGLGPKRAKLIVTESAVRDFFERRKVQPKNVVTAKPYVRRWN